MSRPILATNDDFATIQIDVAAARALGLTEEGIARLVRDAQVTAKVLARATGTRWAVERVEPAEVTGETITDEQITDLRLAGEITPMRARMALAGEATARSRCADAYNARIGGRS